MSASYPSQQSTCKRLLDEERSTWIETLLYERDEARCERDEARAKLADLKQKIADWDRATALLKHVAQP